LLRKLFSLLPVRTRWKTLGLLLLFTASSALEGVGIVLLFYLLKSGATIFLCLVLAAGFVLKTLVQVAATVLRLHVETVVRTDLGTRLLARYLGMTTAEHSRLGTALLIRNVHGNVATCSASVLQVSDLASDTLLTLTLGGTLVYLQPALSALALAVFLLLGSAYILLGRRVFSGWGSAANDASGAMYRELTASLSSVEAVQSLAVEGYFVRRYETALNAYGLLNLKNAALHQSIRPVFEMVFLLAILAFIAANAGEMQDLVPSLAAFAAAAMRILPSIVRGVGVAQHLRFGADAIDTVYDGLMAGPPGPRSDASPCFSPSTIVEDNKIIAEK
jgi:ATP-binding cassette, subfamily B, bacterial PglK